MKKDDYYRCDMCKKVVKLIESKDVSQEEKKKMYNLAMHRIADRLKEVHCGFDKDAICCPRCGEVMYKD